MKLKIDRIGTVSLKGDLFMKKKIITISREFGSGGREIGKRLADILGYDYYDREIISEVAKIGNFSEQYVEEVDEKGYSSGYTLTFGRTLFYPVAAWDNSTRILLAEQKALKEIAGKGRDCIIVGRCADYVLKDRADCLNVFIHSSFEKRAERKSFCASSRSRSPCAYPSR